MGEELIDVIECSLIDHVLTNAEGLLVVYQETYLNCWTSCYTRITGDNAEVQNYWEHLKEEHEAKQVQIENEWKLLQERRETSCV